MSNELWIYDVIGAGLFEEGVTAKGVRDSIAGMDKAEPLLVNINSPGGYVREAVAIMSLLSSWEGGVNVRIDGLAASAASYIAMIGKEIQIVDGSFMMIHNPHTIAVGDARDMRKAADYLDKSQGELAKAYSTRSGKSVDEIKAMLDEETWLTADEAVAQGFADIKIETIKAQSFKIPEAMGFKHPPAKAESPKPRPHNRLAALQRQLDLAR